MEQKSLIQLFKVLIAEDNIELGMALEKTLDQAGFSVRRVSTGKQVLDFCATHSPDNTLLLLDYRLGDLTAKEVVQCLKKQDLSYYFMVMTGFGNENIAVEMMKLGAEEYVVKGDDIVELLVPLLSRVIDGIADKQSLEKAQRKLHTAHQAIMAADDGIVIADLSNADCPITYYNPAFEKITGYCCSCRSTVKGWLDSYNPQQPEVRKLQAALRNQQSAHVRLKLNENFHKVNLCFTPKTAQQQGTFIAIVTDTTQERLSDLQIYQLRWQLERMQHLAIAGQVANELAHEIGQPLTHISSIIQSLVSKNKVGSKDLSTLLGHIDRITNLIRSFSSDESETCLATKVSVASMLDAVIQLCPDNNGVHVFMDIPEEMPKIMADRAKIIQILLNLMTNAMDACGQEGTIHLSASVQTLPETGKQYAAISVKDSGCGIEPENLPKIFDTFFSTKSKSRSRGLGLSICRNIAVQHGGWIEVQSQPGQGACFTLMLPLKPVDVNGAAASETDVNPDLRKG